MDNTADCDGCARLSSGLKPRKHTDGCKKGMYEELKKTEKGRQLLEAAEDRIREWMEEKHNDEEKARPRDRSDSARPTDPDPNPKPPADSWTAGAPYR